MPAGPLVVNCSGLGARRLADDPTSVPVRGQVVVVEQVGLDEWWLAEDGPTYVIPRTDDIVLGGTDDEGEWSRTPTPEVAAGILRRATELVPRLRGARVLRHRVGLRPTRPEIRLERVGDVVHCYGHGGAGVTLSWGCADEVTRLVQGLGQGGAWLSPGARPIRGTEKWSPQACVGVPAGPQQCDDPGCGLPGSEKPGIVDRKVLRPSRRPRVALEVAVSCSVPE